MFITGYSGRFPDADSIPELYSKLLHKQDLVSSSKRYPQGYHGLPDRAGHLKTIDRFDAQFFKLNKLHVDGIDPQIRILLEVAYEAIVDAGLSIASMKGSNTGVYVGHCFSDYHNGVIGNINLVNGYENVGSANSMAANKLSYFFDWHGPSFTVDTACSSSLVAFDRACSDVASGLVDFAIVAGLSLNLRPTITKVFQKYNMVSPTGTCHSFASDADGYCRSETVGALLIQSERVVSSGYARVVAYGVNANGTTQQGITFPSITGQMALIDQVCARFNVDKDSIGFIETHGTGTTAGDNVEITALDRCYGVPGRTMPIGAIKSNLGHAEGASAISSIAKCLFMFEKGICLPNLHYDLASTPHEPLINNRFRVVTDVEPFDTSKLVAINNFGFGGVNAHVILASGGRQYSKPMSSSSSSSPEQQQGKYYVYGRTAEYVLEQLNSNGSSSRTQFFEKNIDDIDRFPFRGVVSPVNPEPVVRKVEGTGSSGGKRSLAFIYSGQGSQYSGMAQSLLASDAVFRDTIHRLSSHLSDISNHTIDLLQLFVDGTKWEEKKYSGIGITSVQIGLTNMLQRTAGIAPSFIIGHSLGEIACSYADGCLTEEQCIKIAYVRSEMVCLLDPHTFIYNFNHAVVTATVDDAELIDQYEGTYIYRVTKDKSDTFEALNQNFLHKVDNHGGMMFVSMVEDTAKELLEALQCYHTNIACYNSIDGLTLSGPYPELLLVEEYMKQYNIFHRFVNTDGIAYHSKLLQPYTSYLLENLEKIISRGSAKLRSSRWLSTSDASNLHCDASYHITNIVGSVYFHQAIQALPDNCVVLEIGPSNGLVGQIKRSRADIVDLLYCMSGREDKGEVSFAKMLDSLWLCGITASLPSSSSSSSSSLDYHLPLEERYRIGWDHDEVCKIVTYKDYEMGASDSIKVSYDLQGDYRFLLDHVIQKQVLFPAMGHVYTMWHYFGLGVDIEISSFAIYRAISLDNCSEVSFEVLFDKNTSQVKVLYDSELVSSAIVKVTATAAAVGTSDDDDGRVVDALLRSDDLSQVVLSKDIYSSFHRYDYNYSTSFQVIDCQSIDNSYTRLKDSSSFDGMHWINYLDGMLQCSISDVKTLKLPTSIQSIRLHALKDGSSFPLLVRTDGVFPNNTISSDTASITGLDTTVAPVSTVKTSSIRRVEFVPYGINIIQDNRVFEYMSQFIKYCHTALSKMFTKDVLLKYPHLSNLQHFIKSNSEGVDVVDEESIPIDSCDSKLINEQQHSFEQQPVFHITKEIYLDPELLVNPLLTMSKHPLYQDLYLKDILFSSSSQSLQICADILNENIRHQYKFLEVGTGTGGALRRIYPLIQYNLESYTASDISTINLDDSLSAIQSLRWNINEPFPSTDQKFDVIFGSNSIHCAKDMTISMTHITDALVDGGYLLLEEYVTELPIYLWGLDSFIWTTAVDQRDFGLWISHTRWLTLFAKLGLELVISFNSSATSLYLLKKKSKSSSSSSVVVSTDSLIASLDQQKITTREELIHKESLVLVGSDNGVLGLVKSLSREPDVASLMQGYLFVNHDDDYLSKKQLQLSHDKDKDKDKDKVIEYSYSDLIGVEKGMLTNVVLCSNGKDDRKTWLHGSFREIEPKSLSPTGVRNWTIQIEKPGFLNTFYYKQASACDVTAVETSVQVSYVGLNFKDVMLSYGKLKLESSSINLGIEFSGCSLKDRSAVMGIDTNCLSQYLPSPPLLWKVPSYMTMREAATIPCVYATVLYCLDHCARIQPKQTILIHAGAGGVGQAAISICLKRGLTVYTTCSNSKRAFLKQKYNLPDDHIGSSRDDSFKSWILAVTHQQGVDVVLNSLSEEKLLLSLDCLATFGHFCEIGKFDIMNNSKIGLKVFSKNISFHGVDISDMIFHPKYNRILHDLVQKGLDDREIEPINVDCIFHHSKMEDAIRYMGSGSHVGKILIAMRSIGNDDDDEEEKKVAAVPDEISPTYMTHGVHLITGGLGGFGLELAEWLVGCGAERVLLLSRSSELKSGYQRRKLSKLTQLEVVQCNVLDEDDVKTCLMHESNLTGIWHLAMLLQDALLMKMTKEQWDTCVQTKAHAATYLDRYSRLYSPCLETFVMFSSISSLYGNAGQTNYAYGNACMEVMAYQRHLQNLPALAICWGRIGNVGYVSNRGKVTTDQRVVDQHIDSCLHDLHAMLNLNCPVVSCYKQGDYQADSNIGSKITTCLDSILRVLGLDSNKVSSSDSLSDLGIDSLQVVTIKSILKNKGIDKDVKEIYDIKVSDLRAIE